jgi:oligopeptide/dipeptide ABC transporter ATP-binding protein
MAAMNEVNEAKLLEIDHLRTQFFTHNGIVRAVDDVSYSIRRGETLAVVGESGCGKSVTALSILRLIPSPPGRIVGGEIRFEGRNLLTLSDQEIQEVRGNEISMIFQEPMTSLNPVLTIGRQISEIIELHQRLPRKAAMAKAIEMLELVNIPEPAKRVRSYAHQLSGGMRQRVMIAMALACNPKLLIADEPTTALDVTIQAQILTLMQGLQDRLGTAILLITHDMGVVAENADRVIVMYAGRKVEEANVFDLFEGPKHPYTAGLLGSIPRRGRMVPAGVSGEQSSPAPSPSHGSSARLQLSEIKGMIPSPFALPPGCAFAPRCPHASTQCTHEYPPYEKKGEGHFAACWHSEFVKVAAD